MERIAIETEEDYQKLIKVLESFNVKVLRPTLRDSIEYYFNGTSYHPPPMTPRDYSAMIGDKFYFGSTLPTPNTYQNFKGIFENNRIFSTGYGYDQHKDILEHISQQGNTVEIGRGIHAANTTRVGKDLYHGTLYGHNLSADGLRQNLEYRKTTFSDYRNHIIDTEGHSDGSFCPVVPGLLISIDDLKYYDKTFSDWEIVHIPHQGWDQVRPFLDLKEKNRGKWWVPGEELNDEFTSFVESWLNHWVGYVEETVFDVNMLVINQKNVICNNYDKKVFAAFERYGITPHVINFRHRYFWDGGLHCITSDLDREGSRNDYFPNRTEEIVQMR